MSIVCVFADIAGGYLCFVVSIFGIGVVTAVIGDIASYFGCTLGIKDSVTAIIFVALGTSIPGKSFSKDSSFNQNAVGKSLKSFRKARARYLCTRTRKIKRDPSECERTSPTTHSETTAKTSAAWIHLNCSLLLLLLLELHQLNPFIYLAVYFATLLKFNLASEWIILHLISKIFVFYSVRVKCFNSK